MGWYSKFFGLNNVVKLYKYGFIVYNEMVDLLILEFNKIKFCNFFLMLINYICFVIVENYKFIKFVVIYI